MPFVDVSLPCVCRFPFKLSGDYNLKNQYIKLEKLHYTLKSAKPSEYDDPRLCALFSSPLSLFLIPVINFHIFVCRALCLSAMMS